MPLREPEMSIARTQQNTRTYTRMKIPKQMYTLHTRSADRDEQQATRIEHKLRDRRYEEQANNRIEHEVVFTIYLISGKTSVRKGARFECIRNYIGVTRQQHNTRINQHTAGGTTGASWLNLVDTVDEAVVLFTTRSKEIAYKGELLAVLWRFLFFKQRNQFPNLTIGEFHGTGGIVRGAFFARPRLRTVELTLLCNMINHNTLPRAPQSFMQDTPSNMSINEQYVQTCSEFFEVFSKWPTVKRHITGACFFCGRAGCQTRICTIPRESQHHAHTNSRARPHAHRCVKRKRAQVREKKFKTPICKPDQHVFNAKNKCTICDRKHHYTRDGPRTKAGRRRANHRCTTECSFEIHTNGTRKRCKNCFYTPQH